MFSLVLSFAPKERTDWGLRGYPPSEYFFFFFPKEQKTAMVPSETTAVIPLSPYLQIPSHHSLIPFILHVFIVAILLLIIIPCADRLSLSPHSSPPIAQSSFVKGRFLDMRQPIRGKSQTFDGLSLPSLDALRRLLPKGRKNV